MENYNIYQDIAERTEGDIYIGVVGPVRTGKSTFIKKFMDLLVIPNIENSYRKERARDELPQSAAGKTIMTTEPKFIPNEAVEIVLGDNATFNVRLIDCVGYIVNGALGHIENNAPRMVSTPWFEEQIPFYQAAEIGTRKVITEHSTIGLVVTTDGSITDIPRADYIEAEARVVKELKEINKPFIMLLNSTKPHDAEVQKLREDLETKYAVPVIAVNCAQLNIDDINTVMEKALFEFPVKEIGINLPKWVDALDSDHWLRMGMMDSIKQAVSKVTKIREVKNSMASLTNYEYIEKIYFDKISLGEGTVLVDIATPEGLFYKILGETSGFDIDGEDKLITLMKELSFVKKEYDKISFALHEVKQKGYGMVTPTIDELSLDEPEIVKQGGRFGVRLRASAPSIHMIRADIETEVSPIVGTEKQSEELVHYLLKEFEVDPRKIWESNIFGKSLHELVNEGLHNKLHRMPEDAQLKLQETLQKIINEGSGGLICIIL
ncbi:stage IV sporulation protein A [Petroclostridium sp. X23]|uniref:stage IV sporulation protein A n=1 Tax=Petroclostridium sp. X23 TaxID=3045146 RepID=UPI0024AE420E|nr:stage IV sporulation protein A [Petroclostridium sp. X23]WHH59864.1 stage IV sporulation protein A [Petroclostridium sp. X23]